MNHPDTKAGGPPPGVSPESILQLWTAYWASAIVGAAAAHKLFTHLAAGARTADDLAQRAGISRRGAQALLDGLTGLGLVRPAAGGYENGAEAAAFLVEGGPTCFVPLFRMAPGGMGLFANLPEVVRTGSPFQASSTDVPENPMWEQLVPAIAPLTAPVARLAAEHLRFAEAGAAAVLDVGGGSGVFALTLLAANPEARATQLDWPNVNAIARGFAARHGAADRFRTLDGDFHVADIGEAAYDVIVYSNIAHQEAPADNVAVFRRLRRALKPGGTLVVNDTVLRDDGSGHPFAGMFSANMLLHTRDGASWRDGDYRQWLAEAGFGDVQIHQTPFPQTLVYAR